MLGIYIAISIVLVLIVICLILYFITFFIVKKKHNSIFDKRCDINPLVDSYTFEEFNLDKTKYEIKYKDDTIIAYLYTKDIKYNDKLIIYCHGMFSTKESYCQDIAYYATNGFKVLALEYLGVGESSGKLAGFGNSLHSLKIVMDYIMKLDEFKDLDIYVIGHSWGGYASLNIPAFYTNIKGVCGIAPFVGIKPYIKYSMKKSNIVANMFLKYDKTKCDIFSLFDASSTLKAYSGKILLIQSKNDNTLSYDSSIGYIKRTITNNNIEYIINDNRYHNPYYLEESVKYLNEFIASLSNIKQEDMKDYFKKQDFRRMGKLDLEIMDQIKEWILK